MNEASNFLLEEEVVPVKFLKELGSCGFVVSQEDSTADIPVGYKANIPFWLAKELASIGVVEIEQPQWLSELNAGASLTSKRSYLFSCDVASSRQDLDSLRHLLQLLFERIPEITNDSLRSSTKLGKPDEKVYLTEEEEMIQKTQNSTASFLRWKKNRIGPNRGL